MADLLGWVRNLSEVSYRSCSAELATALAEFSRSGDCASVLALLEEWEATSELERAPAAMAEVVRPKDYRSVLAEVRSP